MFVTALELLAELLDEICVCFSVGINKIDGVVDCEMNVIFG
jgi:hypothetical protein